MSELTKKLEQIANDLGEDRAAIIRQSIDLIEFYGAEAAKYASAAGQYETRAKAALAELADTKRVANEMAQRAACIERVDLSSDQPKASDVVITERGTVYAHDDYLNDAPPASCIKYVLRINQEHLSCL